MIKRNRISTHGWRNLSSISLLALSVCWATGAQAQETKPSEAAAGDGGLAEIVVTAQKRGENLQKVPIAVSAFSGEALATKGIQSVVELTSIAPGLTYTVQATQATPRIRGIGTAVAGTGNESSVATYVDGVYYASATGSILSFNNVEQVAVLKGPQGTLFGRNATGGLIQITTADPKDQFQGNARIGYGNQNTLGGDLYLTGGLGAGVAANLAVHYSNQMDGFGTNKATGLDVNKTRDIGVRTKFKFDLGDDTTVIAAFDYDHTINAGPAYRPVYGEKALFTGYSFTGGFNDADSNTQPRSSVEQYGTSLNVTHAFSGVKLVSITAYRHTLWDVQFDSDGTPANLFYVNVHEPDKQFSQELQLVSTDNGPFKWMLGGYYFHGKATVSPGTVGLPAFGFVQFVRANQSVSSYAGFAQGTYSLSDATSLTVGLRYTDESKTINSDGELDFIAPAFVLPATPYTANSHVSKLTWRVALDHKVTQDVLIYASYNRGFKSGGYNLFALNTPNSFVPEQLDAFEVGLKSELLDRKLRFNTAAFYYDFKNIQLNTYVNSAPAIYNGKSAKLYGLDADITAAPAQGLTLTAGLSLVHARFDDFPIATTVILPTGGLVLGPFISAKGKRLPQTPSMQINLGFEYKHSLPTGSLSFAGDYFHSTRWYEGPENRLSQAPYSLVNASVTWNLDDDEKYSFKVWGRNLTNARHANQLTAQTNDLDMLQPADPRTYGVSFSVKF
ncbi:TonB-dependent receptor [Aquisediminimonas profunda]|uniref:TonB-dependent receptor n=1 Tax=Aquisediminimonas profunda TaxID=1550733 RepID=UPI001C62ED7B|nr:TonB-dependent receptor [Aquisediminimonas profunda]